jgi:hypothetical protein
MRRRYAGIAALVATLAIGLVGAPSASADTSTELAVVSGTVTDQQSGLPIAGVDVTFQKTDERAVRVAATTDASGQYTVDVPAGNYEATFAKLSPAGTDAYWTSYYPGTYNRGDASNIVVVGGTDRAGMDVALPKAGGISGTVSLAGKPIKSASVELWNDMAYLPAVKVTNGTYSAFPLPVGSYRVRLVAYQDDAFLTTFLGNTVREPDAKVITVEPGESATNVNIAAKAGATVKGKVTDSKGRPIKGRAVRAQNLTRYGWGEAVTDANGAYVIHGMATGKVQVAIYSPRRWYIPLVSTTVQAVQGKTLAAKTLVQRAPSTITGSVAVKSGTTRYLTVSLLDSEKRTVDTHSPRAKGRITFTDLPAGRYTVVISGANTATKVTVKSGQKVSFGKLTRGKQSTLKGVVRKPDGTLASSGRVSLVDAYGASAGYANVTAKGTYSILGLVRGKYTVRADRFGLSDDVHFAGTTTLAVKAGHGATASIKVKPSGTLTGVVKNAQGKPVAGIEAYGAPGFYDDNDEWGSSWTDSTGKYVVKGLPAGTRRVWFRDNYVGGYLTATKTATVVAGKTTKVSTLTLR